MAIIDPQIIFSVILYTCTVTAIQLYTTGMNVYNNIGANNNLLGFKIYWFQTRVISIFKVHMDSSCIHLLRVFRCSITSTLWSLSSHSCPKFVSGLRVSTSYERADGLNPHLQSSKFHIDNSVETVQGTTNLHLNLSY